MTLSVLADKEGKDEKEPLLSSLRQPPCAAEPFSQDRFSVSSPQKCLRIYVFKEFLEGNRRPVVV